MKVTYAVVVRSLVVRVRVVVICRGVELGDALDEVPCLLDVKYMYCVVVMPKFSSHQILFVTSPGTPTTQTLNASAVRQGPRNLLRNRRSPTSYLPPRYTTSRDPPRQVRAALFT